MDFYSTSMTQDNESYLVDSLYDSLTKHFPSQTSSQPEKDLTPMTEVDELKCITLENMIIALMKRDSSMVSFLVQKYGEMLNKGPVKLLTTSGMPLFYYYLVYFRGCLEPMNGESVMESLVNLMVNSLIYASPEVLSDISVATAATAVVDEVTLKVFETFDGSSRWSTIVGFYITIFKFLNISSTKFEFPKIHCLTSQKSFQDKLISIIGKGAIAAQLDNMDEREFTDFSNNMFEYVHTYMEFISSQKREWNTKCSIVLLKLLVGSLSMNRDNSELTPMSKLTYNINAWINDCLINIHSYPGESNISLQEEVTQLETCMVDVIRLFTMPYRESTRQLKIVCDIIDTKTMTCRSCLEITESMEKMICLGYEGITLLQEIVGVLMNSTFDINEIRWDVLEKLVTNNLHISSSMLRMIVENILHGKLCRETYYINLKVLSRLSSMCKPEDYEMPIPYRGSIKRIIYILFEMYLNSHSLVNDSTIGVLLSGASYSQVHQEISNLKSIELTKSLLKILSSYNFHTMIPRLH